MKLPDDMDPECIPICEAMNRLPGIKTTGSCCGHGRRTFIICFKAESMQALATVAYVADECHCNYSGWLVRASTDCSMMPAVFILEGPKDEESYAQAAYIATVMGDMRASAIRRVEGEESTQWHCPQCRTEDVEEGKEEFDDHGRTQYYVCNVCGCEFHEFYEVGFEYADSVIDLEGRQATG